MKATKENFGKLIWNGNELVFANSPNVGVAGIAPGMPDELGEEIARRCTAVDALKERVTELETELVELLHAPTVDALQERLKQAEEVIKDLNKYADKKGLSSLMFMQRVINRLEKYKDDKGE